MMKITFTAIGNRLTRLPSAVHFDPLMLPAPDPSAPCKLGLPPEPLRALHWPALADACYERVKALLEYPVAIEHESDTLRLGVLGVLVLERQDDGTWRSWQWRPAEFVDGGRVRPTLEHVPEREVLAQGLPYKTAWTQRLVLALVATLASQGGSTELHERYARWIRDGIIEQLWTKPVQRRVREKIAQALALDPLLLQQARRRHMRRTGTRFVRIDDYNRMIWRAAHWPCIKEQTPQFTWLLELLWHRLPTASDPLQMLKALLKAEGVNCGLWRVLHEQGTRWMRLFMPYYTLGARGSGRAALDLLRLVSLFGRPQLPPMWMLQAVLNERGNPNAPKERYAAGWSQPDRQPLLWRLMHWHHRLEQAGDDATLEQLQQLMPVILHWADGHRELIASPWLQKIGVKRFMQRIVQWDRELDVSVGEQSDWAPSTCSTKWLARLGTSWS